MKNTLNNTLKDSAAVRAITGVLLFLACFWVFSGMASGKLRRGSDNLNYYKDFAIAYSQGRLDIKDCPQGTDCYDAISYKGRHYIYQPPVPALVYLPLVKIWGRNTPDFLINAVIGALNSVMVFFILILLAQKLGLKISAYWHALLALFWAFGTVQFYITMLGSIWFISQSMGQFFILMSVLFVVLGGRTLFIALAGLFFAMACYCKNDLVFYAVLIAALYWLFYLKKAALKQTVTGALIFLLPFILFSAASLAHNAARFDGNMLELGIKYHKMNQVFVSDFLQYGYLSPVYIPYNFFSEVIMPPPFAAAFPFFSYSKDGFGFLWASPVFMLSFISIWFLAYGFGGKKAEALKGAVKTYLIGAYISLGLVAFLIFLLMGNGWEQFASRYSFDYQFLMLACLLPVIYKWQKHAGFNMAFMALLVVSVYMNYYGMKAFLHI
jgi:hypothetical protein